MFELNNIINKYYKKPVNNNLKILIKVKGNLIKYNKSSNIKLIKNNKTSISKLISNSITNNIESYSNNYLKKNKKSQDIKIKLIIKKLYFSSKRITYHNIKEEISKSSNKNQSKANILKTDKIKNYLSKLNLYSNFINNRKYCNNNFKIDNKIRNKFNKLIKSIN